MKASSCSCTFLTCFFILLLFDSYSTLGVRASLLLRSPKKREAQQCPDGLYHHGTIACCLCAIGQRLEQHCLAGSPDKTECDQCESGTYNSHPNQDRNCQRCTSCSHTNANLEVETLCTVARDTKCRCKTHHYCISANDQDCKLCSPCTECGMEGIKVACTATNDTVCNAQLERRSNRQSSNNPTTFEVEMQSISLPDTDPIRHLPAVAEVLGWTTMANVARRSGMSPIVIDSCELDYPRNSQEQTLQLLRKWVEEQGMDAMKKLIQTLTNIKQNYTAQRVLAVLSNV
ncbi:tumor necrosis factor receptor superfamily member 6-like isoform X2 [Phycodurus eques]|uniref:tumor necrosis factor receptor superfamily member 6-like isoform X2 n=1 Tax=Phycodurus eques TaxID=693459 RepID=UPI002ACDFE86|nr:tumor necrosis factor receptor superfamily member 6-like isoform X2 [Phycodurus eques]